nr:glycoside hydrolase family 13 protein [Microbacterium protaetiae]
MYQVYLRSFRDGDGDGIGDLAGLTAGLPEIARLGCDAVWLNPCYVSPQRDHGYDIEDYFSIDPGYGSLADFDMMIAEAHGLGLRVLMDMVANHCSIAHPWFREALTSGPGSEARERFLFRDGRGPAGEEPPGNWQSVFGGSAWTRVVESDGAPGQWYLHSFDAGQPDFNWRNPEVAAYFLDVLRFWFDRGVDGFRIDVAHGHVKAEGLPDNHVAGGNGHNAAMWDQPEVHEIYRAWRRLGDAYPEPKFFVGEVWVPTAESLARYLRRDELHQAFCFDLLVQPWDAARMRAAIDRGLETGDGAPAWTLANHDVHRAVTRYGQQQSFDAPSPTDMIAAARQNGPVDVATGMRRARAAAALLFALPGSAYLYQGEELGLPEVLDLPAEARQDPIWHRSGGSTLGRDGCRVPLPWQAEAPAFGFGGDPAMNWLPQPSWFGDFARDRQQEDPHSMLTLYRELLAGRETFAAGEPLQWLDTPRDVLAFSRADAVCVVNLGPEPFIIPSRWGPVDETVSTAPHSPGCVPPDSATWLRRS